MIDKAQRKNDQASMRGGAAVQTGEPMRPCARCPDSEVRMIFACCSAISIVRRQKRWMAPRMSSADLVHLKGLGFWFVVSM